MHKKLLTAIICLSLFAGCTKTDTGNGNSTVTVVPLPPTDLQGAALSTTQVELSWTDKSTNETGFKIQRKTGTETFKDVATLNADVTNYTDNGLIPNTTYIYRVYAYNNVGNSLTYTNEVSVTTNANIVLATLTTTTVSSITQTTATSGGNITSDGGATVIARGVVWSTSTNPTISLAIKTVDGAGTGSFTSNIIGLTANTTYYIRAYATNSVGTAYGNEVSFKTLSAPPTNSVTDIDGNSYPTVTIGSQVWMAENLRTTKYRDGSAIPLVTDNTQWANNSNTGATSPMMCWYNNDKTTYTNNKMGALYNWYAINPATNGNKNVCPTGWHVPSDDEWTTLTTFLGGDGVAGGKMKTTGTQYWLSPNQDATNSSGFSGLPGGYRDDDGAFDGIGYYGSWWSSSEYDTGFAWFRVLVYDDGGVLRYGYDEAGGFSVRCLRD